MVYDVYTSGALVRVVQSLENEPITFFRDRYFPFEQFSTQETIFFDVVDKKRRLAPFVSPLVQGKLMEARGYATRSFKPAYVKPKSEINPNDQFKRRAGEQLAGSMTPSERRAAAVREALMEHMESLDMREEVMASEALRLGQVTVSGEGYGTVVLDFGRDAALTIALAGAATWDNAGVDPLADIEAWALLIRQKSNVIARDVVMDPDAFTNMKARLTDPQLEQLFDFRRSGQSNMRLGPRTAEKVRYEGRIGSFDFWTYSDTYLDEDGAEQDIMPSGQVVVCGSGEALEGTRAYGAIRDPRAGLQAIRAFPKNWIQEDPATEFLMTQSAPLLVPTRPNASLGATVLP